MATARFLGFEISLGIIADQALLLLKINDSRRQDPSTADGLEHMSSGHLSIIDHRAWLFSIAEAGGLASLDLLTLPLISLSLFVFLLTLPW